MKVLMLVLSLLTPIQHLDHEVARMVQEHRRPALEGPFHTLNRVATPVNVIGGMVVIAIIEGTAGAGTVRVALVAMAGANLLVEGLKRLTYRARPDGEHKRSNASFPSGHAATAFALAWVLSKRWPRLVALFVPLALAIAFSRMYLNRHYLSDVAVGSLIGLGCGWAATRWIPPWAKRERPEDAPPIADVVR